MSAPVRSMLMTTVALVLAGTIGIAASHVFGQGFEDDPVFVPPSPATSFPPPVSAIPPSPSNFVGTVGSPSPSAASPPKATATTSPPFGYSRMKTGAVRPATLPSTIATPVRQSTSDSNLREASTTSGKPSEANANAANTIIKTSAIGQTGRTTGVTQAGHLDSLYYPNLDPSLGPPPDSSGRVPRKVRKAEKEQVSAPAMSVPMDRQSPPAIRGSHLGLLPGETATERSMRLMSAVADLERQLESANQRNVELSEMIRQRDDQLLLAIREIRSARKDVASARDELGRLKDVVKGLNEKVANSERDSAALLQTLAPLLYQMLNTEDASLSKAGE